MSVQIGVRAWWSSPNPTIVCKSAWISRVWMRASVVSNIHSPVAEQILAQICGAKYFSKLDANSEVIHYIYAFGNLYIHRYYSAQLECVGWPSHGQKPLMSDRTRCDTLSKHLILGGWRKVEEYLLNIFHHICTHTVGCAVSEFSYPLVL